jgi:Uma2 family endonuclease
MQAIEKPAIAPPKRYSLAEYFALEEQAESKSEFHDGEIVAVTGGTFNHNALALNIAAFLKYALKGKAFRPFCGDVKVWIEKHQRAAYPDVMAIAGAPASYKKRKDTLTNPCLVIEVLSKSTAEYDQTEKFKFCRSLDSLQEYVLVNQYDIEVQQYTRTNEGFWQYRAYESLEDTVHLTSIETDIAVADIYEGIELEAVES